MRIVVPIHSFQPGGVERVALRLAAAWQAQGQEVTVVLGRAEGPGKPPEAADLPYCVYGAAIRTGRFETLWMIVCLYRFLRREPADILFCPGNTYSVVCAAMRLLLGNRCPRVVAKVSNDLRRSGLPLPARIGYRLWVRAHARFIDRFVAIAEPMASEIADQVAIDPARIEVIPDPALTADEWTRLSSRERTRCPREGACIVAVGRLVPQKNFALLLRAFALHVPETDRLVIAGEGPERARLQRLAARLGISARVEFAGHCDVLALLERADFFALSSDYEGVPAAVIEALAAGLPMVVTDCSSSMAWLIGYGTDGLIVPVKDAESLGRALSNVRNLPLQGSGGRERAARFTVEHATGSYLELFQAEAAIRSGPVRQRLPHYGESNQLHDVGPLGQGEEKFPVEVRMELGGDVVKLSTQ